MMFDLTQHRGKKSSLATTTKFHQVLMQLHDKGCISTQTLCEELGIKLSDFKK